MCRTKLAGKFSTTVRSLTTDREVEAKFLVLENNSNSRPLLSLTTGVNLGIISIVNAVTGTPFNKDQLKREFPSAFNGFGKNTKIKAKYIEDTSVTPITQKPKRVPYNLKKRTMEEEDRLIAQDIIEMVPDDVPTTWCTNLVIAPKRHDPEAIRYCSYMRAPNTAIKRPITEALTVEDIKVRLEGSKVFSILDMNEAYHQLELCEEIVTWQHSVARVVEWDIKDWITQDIFYKADDTIHGLDGVLHIRDDFIIHGSSQEEHDAWLRAFMACMMENGLTFSFKKCKIGLPKIEFFGIQFHADCTSPSSQTHWISAAHASSPVSRRGELAAQHGAALGPIHPQLLHHDRSSKGPHETRHSMELGEAPWRSLQKAVQVSVK